MKVEAAINLPTPGALEVAKQDWRRDPTTWRQRFLLTHLTPKLSGLEDNPEAAAPIRAHWNEAADALERYFDSLPKWTPRVNRLGHRY